jgi:uncharacterized membrane protein YcaP (DUF421 family)
MLFDGWMTLLRTLVVGILAYALLVAMLRISGKRTLSKLNAFDLVVTVALGSTLATILLDQNVALAEGVVAFAVLIGLQFAVTWSSVRMKWIRRVVTGEPQLLAWRGQLLPDSLLKARLTEDEVNASLRAAGRADLAGAQAVVLETDGSITVVHHGSDRPASALKDLQG